MKRVFPYYGKNFPSQKRSSCEILQEVHKPQQNKRVYYIADLQKAITQSLDKYYLDKFATNVFHTSLKIKNKLEKILNNIGDAD